MAGSVQHLNATPAGDISLRATARDIAGRTPSARDPISVMALAHLAPGTERGFGQKDARVAPLVLAAPSGSSAHPLAKLKSAIQCGDQDAIAGVLHSASDQEALRLIGDAHLSSFHHTLDNNHFLFVESVFRRFPQKSRYFVMIREDEESGRSHRTILSAEGVAQAVNFLHEKRKLSDRSETVVCESYDALRAEMQRMTHGEHAGEDRYFLVRHTDASVPEAFRIHFSAVYMRSPDKERPLSAYISDSNATAHVSRTDPLDPGKGYAFRLANVISRDYPEALMFANMEGRQSDWSNCSVFSMHDVIQMQKLGNMVQYAEAHVPQSLRHANYPGVSLRAVADLPTGMQKITQSLTKVKSVAESMQDPVERARLEAAVSKHTEMSQGRPVNASIAKKYLQFERYILTRPG